MTIKQIYTSIDELIEILKGSEYQSLSTILEHRMYKVSWTSGYEMLEEITSVLRRFISEHENTLNESVAKKINIIIEDIQSFSVNR